MRYGLAGQIDYSDVAIATATGMIGAGTTLLPSALMNSGDALASAGYKGKNPSVSLGAAGQLFWVMVLEKLWK
jgi:hypothetical protein